MYVKWCGSGGCSYTRGEGVPEMVLERELSLT